MPYCDKPKGLCVCHGYRCCDPPVIPGKRRVVKHCNTHVNGCHKRCRRKPGPEEVKKIIQKRITKVVQREIVEYYCDRCGARCGTKDNRKSTWYSRVGDKHFCLRTCHPADHPSWELRHVLNCELCYRDAMERQDGMHMRVAEAILRTLKGER